MSQGQKPEIPTSYYVIILLFLFFFTIGGCMRGARDGAPNYHIDVSKIKNPKPHYLPKSKYGNPEHYTVFGKRYHVLKTSKNYDKRGIASWYGTKFDGRLTSTRERYHLTDMTAASPELPIPCFVRVTNLENGQQVIVKVNDRGPFANNRIMDLSYVAAKKLGYTGKGTALVQVTSIDAPNPLAETRRDFAHHRPELYLQVGAFAMIHNANRLSSELKRLTQRKIRVLHTGHLYRVQIGPLKNVAESDHLETKIAQQGLGRVITVVG